MKVVIIFAAIVAFATGASITPSKEATILRYDVENIGIDGYKFNVETSDGVSRSEEAIVQNLGSDHESLVIRGTISYVDNEGKPYTLSFVADENGFQPVGDHLPKA